jgi:hypothetical protein
MEVSERSLRLFAAVVMPRIQVRAGMRNLSVAGTASG